MSQAGGLKKGTNLRYGDLGIILRGSHGTSCFHNPILKPNLFNL